MSRVGMAGCSALVFCFSLVSDHLAAFCTFSFLHETACTVQMASFMALLLCIAMKYAQKGQQDAAGTEIGQQPRLLKAAKLVP